MSIDRTKNRVYFLLHKGLWKDEDLFFLLPDWKEVVAEMKPKFTIISDIRALQIQSPKYNTIHEEAQRYVSENGLLKVARILPDDNDIVNLQFGRIVKRSAIPSNVFYSVEDAEKYLDRIVEQFEESDEVKK